MLLKTLGHPALRRADGSLAGGLRRKDLALLVYLCVEGVPVHARGRLAALLWGESPEERARHSLTQALGRLARVLEPGIMVPDKDAVRWSDGLPCDAVALLREGVEPGEADDGFSLYAGHFLEGFDAGAGAEEFHEWADRRRAELRNAALRLLERAGEQAEAAAAWARALRLGERAVEIDPVWEQGHRRVMRALAARGERNGALRYYQRLEAWLAEEVGGEPDPETRALAEQLRAPDAPEPRPLAPDSIAAANPPAPDPVVAAIAHPHAPGPLPAPPADPPPAAGDPDPPHPPAAADPPRIDPDPPRLAFAPPGAADPPAPPHPPGARRDTAAPGRAADGRSLALSLSMVLAGALLTLMIALARERAGSTAAEYPPAHGESVRLRGTDRTFLAFGETLYEFPDSLTLCACTGWHPGVARVIRALPPWPRHVLPSASRHGWMDGRRPVALSGTVYVAVGCMLTSTSNRETLDSIFGPEAAEQVVKVPDTLLHHLPRAFVARGHPMRKAGTLIRGADNRVRWITYHGGALEVTDPSLLATHCRSPDEAVRVDEREFRYYRSWGTLGRGSGKCPRAPSPEPAP